MHADIVAWFKASRHAARGQFFFVLGQDRELEMGAGGRRSELAGQVQQALRFGAGFGAGREDGVIGD